MSRMRKRFLDCSAMDMKQAEQWGKDLAETQRDIMFWIADLARYSESRWPDSHAQVWPEWISPGMIARASGVGKAYPNEADRQHEATYSQYMQVAGKHDRHERLAAIVDSGMTTDESRKAGSEKELPRNEQANNAWLIGFDIHYFAHRHFYSGAGVETALQVAEWVQRTVERLKPKGVTDAVCAFEGNGSFRKQLTKDWVGEHYKDRPAKPSDLTYQLRSVRELLTGFGFACVSVDDYEADDVLASYAAQFPGKTTIVSADKDLRQSLSVKCNMLLDVEWIQDPTSGEMLPEYKWLSAKQHTDKTGIPPNQWVEYQIIMGDATDGIKGCSGIGEKGAADLVKEFGTVAAAIQAAKDGDDRIKPKKREALIEFESKLEITRKLVTLRTDLPLPTATKV